MNAINALLKVGLFEENNIFLTYSLNIFCVSKWVLGVVSVRNFQGVLLHALLLFDPGARRVRQWYFVTKIVLTYREKKCSIDREKLLKFEAEGREFAKFLRSLEQQ